MNLIEKLESVEIKADNRISEKDRGFCEAQQTAYDAAREDLKRLDELWSEVSSNQWNILEDVADCSYDKERYIQIPGLSRSHIVDTLEKSHTHFISCLVDYFNRAYRVSISDRDIEEHLLPTEPLRYNHGDESRKQYHEKLRALSLRYEDIVDQVFVQLGGRTFDERAFSELQGKCHKGAWNSYQKTAQYTLKNDTVQLSYGCRYENWFGSERWEPNDSLKDILRGVAHFETGSYDSYPHSFSELLGWGRIECPLYEYSTCDKLRHIKLFKNGRVDIKFTSKANANQFVTEYLGRVF